MYLIKGLYEASRYAIESYPKTYNELSLTFASFCSKILDYKLWFSFKCLLSCHFQRYFPTAQVHYTFSKSYRYFQVNHLILNNSSGRSLWSTSFIYALNNIDKTLNYMILKSKSPYHQYIFVLLTHSIFYNFINTSIFSIIIATTRCFINVLMIYH